MLRVEVSKDVLVTMLLIHTRTILIPVGVLV